VSSALASINTDKPDDDTITSAAALSKLTTEQLAELDRLLTEKYKNADEDATISLTDIIDAVVAMLRDSENSV
jgi:hypothetical protein